MFTWEIEVPAISGDNSVPINAAIAALSSSQGGGTVYLDPVVYQVFSPIMRKSNVSIRGAFKAAGMWDTAVTQGTIIKWTGPAGGVIFVDQPGDGSDTILNGGITDLTMDGSGLAKAGLSSLNCYFAYYGRMHCMGVTDFAYYFGTLPTVSVQQNRNNRLDSLSASLTGSAHGFYLDGYPGPGRNTCFMVATNCEVAHLNGSGFVISNGDDNCFYGCSASRAQGGTGVGVYFGGLPDGSKVAYATQFYGFWSNGGIYAASGSRGNIVYTTAVDGRPLIYQQNGSTLTVLSVDGEAGLAGLVRGWPQAG